MKRTPQPALTQSKLTSMLQPIPQRAEILAVEMDIDQGDGTQAASGASAGSVPDGVGAVQPAGEAARKGTVPPNAPPAAPGAVDANTVEFFLKEMKKNMDDIIKSFTSQMSAVSGRVEENSQAISTNSAAIGRNTEMVME